MSCVAVFCSSPLLCRLWQVIQIFQFESSMWPGLRTVALESEKTGLESYLRDLECPSAGALWARLDIWPHSVTIGLIWHHIN